MKLSIIIPVYNEINTINQILKKIDSVNLGCIEKEVIIVDDGSTDGTKEIIKDLKDYKVMFHETNKGKGSAIRTGLKYVSGDYVIIQDADLEYNPEDYNKLLKPVIEEKYSVVYGSRFLGKKYKDLMINYCGNKILTFFTNLLYNAQLTDMETCYKLFKSDVIKGINLKSKRFDFEPEITTKVLRKGLKIKEVPIDYTFRNYNEGKKITYTDGLKAVYYLFKYRFSKK